MSSRSGALARRYGRALFECAIEASRKDNFTQFEQFVVSSRILLSFFSKKVIYFFTNPTLSLSEKNGLLEVVLNKIFNNKLPPEEFVSFLKLTLENHRFFMIDYVIKDFLLRADEHLGVARATVVSAMSLDENIKADFTTVLHSVLKKNIVLETEIDVSIRSGFIIKIGNTNVDASLRSRLLNLKESLS